MEDCRIVVAIRKRPLTKKELKRDEKDIVVINNNNSLILKEERQKVDLTRYLEEHLFRFDGVFDQNQSNQEVYRGIVRPLVASAFEGSKVTCFAYGQTGSGKTFTMMGNPDQGVKGLYMLAAEDIFSLVSSKQFNNIIISMSFYEIYCGKAFDLLNNRASCPIRVDAKENVHIVGLLEKDIESAEGLMLVVRYGMQVRMTGSTGGNEESSRSHAILQIRLLENESGFELGKMSFIDLAGSERGADVTDTNRQTRFDGAEINKSLLALKECIRAMDQEKKHLPFRGSKLTLVLKDSFIGNCKTLMIGNISPAICACEHTLNTLRYADRVKDLKRSDKESIREGPLRNKKGQDRLAYELMLPRMEKNTQRTLIQENQYNQTSRTRMGRLSEGGPFMNMNTEMKRLSERGDFGEKSEYIDYSIQMKTKPTLDNFSNNGQTNNFSITNFENRSYLSNPSLPPQHTQTPIKSKQQFPISFEALSSQQDDLIDNHSKQVDQLVNCVKLEMSLLQNLKETRSFISRRHSCLSQSIPAHSRTEKSSH